MHEFSLVESMVQLVKQSASENGIKRVSRVKLVVGKLIMAQPELLQFSFEILRGGTVLEEATLEIEERPLVMRCRECGNSYSPELAEFFCPVCNGAAEVLSGKELYVEHYEGVVHDDTNYYLTVAADVAAQKTFASR
ncbi:MAG: hydrogenase maturation nickel metallochaperone HypA [Firmicutes bacterium]|nr:hydrogenase maturation nickel metallochaperone HypA [Bacillota bacterium]